MRAANVYAESTPLGQAKRFLRSKLNEGIECPCCAQFAKRYRRPMNKGQAEMLVALVRIYRETRDWVHVKDLSSPHIAISRGGDFPKLRFWGLISEKENDDDRKLTSGFWKPTRLGVLFVLGRATVPGRAIIYNKRLEGLTGDEIGVEDALGRPFDLREIG